MPAEIWVPALGTTAFIMLALWGVPGSDGRTSTDRAGAYARRYHTAPRHNGTQPMQNPRRWLTPQQEARYNPWFGVAVVDQPTLEIRRPTSATADGRAAHGRRRELALTR